MSVPSRVLAVVGARPNFMKVAPILRELARWPELFATRLLHTGQHYDAAMSDVFFGQLGMPRPDVHLGVGSASHAQQTAAIMAAFEPVLVDWRPDLTIVVGDVNSTMACALVAAKLGVRVAHVEAGLRSFDRAMPEEINRVVTDHLSDVLFVTEESGVENLRREGIPDARIHFVGNVMIDTLLAHRAAAERLDVPSRLGLTANGYVVLTLHRPSNVDDLSTLERLVQALGRIGRDVPVVFPVHPRTRPALSRSASAAELVRAGTLRLIEPLGYLEFVGLMAASRAVLTDSGGIQEETTVLGIPCLTLRENTERPITIKSGTNRLVGTDPPTIVAAWNAIGQDSGRTARPPLWDGRAAARIVEVMRSQLAVSVAGYSPAAS